MSDALTRVFLFFLNFLIYIIIDYREYNPERPVCLILGREYDGVSQELLDIADCFIHLPLLGMANSINVSTAASVVMYDVYSKLELLKQKSFGYDSNLTSKKHK